MAGNRTGWLKIIGFYASIVSIPYSPIKIRVFSTYIYKKYLVEIVMIVCHHISLI